MIDDKSWTNTLAFQELPNKLKINGNVVCVVQTKRTHYTNVNEVFKGRNQINASSHVISPERWFNTVNIITFLPVK